MDNALLVVNGQGNSVDQTGGAGKYAGELYARLNGTGAERDLPGKDVLLVNFYGAVQCDQRQRGRARSMVLAGARVAQRWLPPVVSDGLSGLRARILGECGEGRVGQATDSSLIMERVKTRSYSRIVIHELSNYKHCLETGRLALLPSFRLAVTFLDVQDLYYPECFNDGILTRRRVGYAFFRERADVFFAISEFTKTTMVDRLRIDADRIKVVHLAGDDIARTVPSAEARQRAEAFGRYWIYPAKAWPHKNHALLFRALEARRDALKRSGVRLLLTGGFSSKDVRYLTDLAATCHVRDIVKVLGFQAQADLRALIERAEMMVFPSLFEGFGMPVLEAMVLGCPVACSRATALPEIGGDSALYFDPYSSESLIGVVEDVLAGHVDLAGLARRGKANALRFSWAETYQATIRGYEALLC